MQCILSRELQGSSAGPPSLVPLMPIHPLGRADLHRHGASYLDSVLICLGHAGFISPPLGDPGRLRQLLGLWIISES